MSKKAEGVEAPLTFNDGQWSEARMNGFIKSALRKASMKWPPKHRIKSNARVARGIYRCAGFLRPTHSVSASILRNGKRIDNIMVDHINPVIDPQKGFEGWDILINRLFCNSDNLQVLCFDCHNKKTKEERKKHA